MMMVESSEVQIFYGARQVEKLEGDNLFFGNIQIKAAELGSPKVKIYTGDGVIEIHYLNSLTSKGLEKDVICEQTIWTGAGYKLEMIFKPKKSGDVNDGR